MTTLPSEMSANELWANHAGQFVEIKPGTTLTKVGGIVPIEPEIVLPDGGYAVAGGVPAGEPPFVFYTEIAAYVRSYVGLVRTHHYRFSDGKFTPAAVPQQENP